MFELDFPASFEYHCYRSTILYFFSAGNDLKRQNLTSIDVRFIYRRQIYGWYTVIYTVDRLVDRNMLCAACFVVSIVGSLRDREVACSASDRQGSNFESCVWRTVLSYPGGKTRFTDTACCKRLGTWNDIYIYLGSQPRCTTLQIDYSKLAGSQ